MMQRFAGLYKTNGTDVNSVEALEKLSQWDLSGEFGADAQLTTDSIEIEIPGNYFMDCTLSFKGEAGATYYAEIRRNGARIAGGFLSGQYVATADKLYTMTIIGAHLLQDGDLISVYVGSDQVGGANFQLVYGQFGVLSI